MLMPRSSKVYLAIAVLMAFLLAIAWWLRCRVGRSEQVAHVAHSGQADTPHADRALEEGSNSRPRKGPSDDRPLRAPGSTPCYGTLKVVVKDEYGNPLEGALVDVSYSSSHSQASYAELGVKSSGNTDQSGAAILPLRLERTRYPDVEVEVSCKGYVMRRVKVDRPSEDHTKDVDVCLDRGSPLTGVIAGVEPQHLVAQWGVWLEASARYKDAHWRVEAELHPDGTFLVDGAPPIPVSLGFRDPYDRYEDTDMAVPYPFASVTMNVARGKKSGTITVKHNSPQSKSIYAHFYSHDKGRVLEHIALDSESKTVYLAPGSYTIFVASDFRAGKGVNCAGIYLLQVTEGVTQEVLLNIGQGSTVSMTLMGSPGRPVTGKCEFSVEGFTPGKPGHIERYFDELTDGRLLLSSLLPGYVVRVELPGFKPIEHSITAGPGGREEVTIPLVPK